MNLYETLFFIWMCFLFGSLCLSDQAIKKNTSDIKELQTQIKELKAQADLPENKDLKKSIQEAE